MPRSIDGLRSTALARIRVWGAAPIRRSRSGSWAIRIRPPTGAQILTVAQSGDDAAGEQGERVWALPDVPPATDVETFLALAEPPLHRDLQTFAFTLTFLSSDEAEVPLGRESDGDGCPEPVRTEPVVLTIVQ